MDEQNFRKIFSTNLYIIFLMLWYRYRKVPGRGDTMLVADSRGHMCLRSSDVAKIDPSAADVALAVCNVIVQDARTHAHQ
jgi:hypothetical protein